MNAKDMELSMKRTYVDNRGFTEIPTHYIVGCEGDFVKSNQLDKIVGAVVKDKNHTLETALDANANGIHIEVVGKFTEHHPTFKQYNTLRNLVGWIKEKHPNAIIKYHSDFQTKSCPGKFFDKNFMNMKTFSLSRYYSVVVGQKRYYNGKTYEEDFKMNCHGNCLSTANSTKLNNSMRGKTIACPPEYKLGTKFYLEGIGEVTCNDRGGAIKNNRLDMRCGIGDYALDNRKTCPTGPRKGYVLPIK